MGVHGTVSSPGIWFAINFFYFIFYRSLWPLRSFFWFHWSVKSGWLGPIRETTKSTCLDSKLRYLSHYWPCMASQHFLPLIATTSFIALVVLVWEVNRKNCAHTWSVSGDSLCLRYLFTSTAALNLNCQKNTLFPSHVRNVFWAIILYNIIINITLGVFQGIHSV